MAKMSVDSIGITLTREEVREAREDIEGSEDRCSRFLRTPNWCERTYEGQEIPPYCRLCKRLTEFATLTVSRGKGEEDE